MQYQDLFEMITDVRRAVAAGDRVVNMDSPMTRHLGYQGLTQEWSISVSDIKKMWPQRADWTPEQSDIYSRVKTAKGRLDVVYGIADTLEQKAPEKAALDKLLRTLFKE